MMPQRFLLPTVASPSQPVPLLAKVFDNILITGKIDVVNNMIQSFHERFPLGTVVQGPGVMHFFGLNLTQHEDFAITIDGDNKLE